MGRIHQCRNGSWCVGRARRSQRFLSNRYLLPKGTDIFRSAILAAACHWLAPSTSKGTPMHLAPAVSAFVLAVMLSACGSMPFMDRIPLWDGDPEKVAA